MSWYKTGTVTVANGSATITGVGTAFVANVTTGEEFRLIGASVGYEITGIVSDTELTLARPYLGSSQSGADYEIVPVKGFLRAASDALTAAIAAMNAHLNGALSGRFGPGSLAAPSLSGDSDTNSGIRFPGNDTVEGITNGIRRWLLSGSAFQIDVPVTGTALQANASDDTPGKLMPVGAFGLGENTALPSATGNDLDNALATGWYDIDAATTNSPLAGQAGHCRVELRTAQRIVQTAQRVAGGSVPQTFIRQSHGSDPLLWTDWHEVFNAATLLGSVAQSAGVPTGAVIERGNNASGEYVRFADGTQICTRLASLGTRSSTSNSGGLHRTETLSFAFPAAFAVGSQVAASQSTSLFPSGLIFAVSANTSQWSCRVARPTAFTDIAMPDTNLMAVGRWF